ncbi:MAG: universal stress protein [Nitrospiraceae bacterium]|nr:universal stress protein [Nitrospiraceae bacterium]
MGRYKKILVAVDGSESSRNALHQAFKLANEEKCWITVTSVVPPYEGEAEAYQAINNLAMEQKADMIILGSHGRTGLRRLLMGSVTEKVIGYASCPVLVVKQ